MNPMLAAASTARTESSAVAAVATVAEAAGSSSTVATVVAEVGTAVVGPATARATVPGSVLRKQKTTKTTTSKVAEDPSVAEDIDTNLAEGFGSNLMRELHRRYVHLREPNQRTRLAATRILPSCEPGGRLTQHQARGRCES
jgi:hypothetical protein